ncbi:hypothetical protein ES708_29603 [subsurface metagenome]
MADKLEELKQALEGISPEGLKLVAEFARFLARLQKNGLAH